MSDVARPAILSLFSGVGGLDLGLKLALPRAFVLGYVERDAYAATVLMARMEDESLERAPVFIGDIQNLDGSELCGRVDILCGGFPCQDISVAGKGVGIGGKRSGLWSEIVRLADEIRPRYLFLENVSAITSRGLDVVLADLAELGFDAEWLCLRASDVGAPHRRERWFCLAHAERTRRVQTRQRRELDAGGQLAEGCGGMDDAIEQRPRGQQQDGSAARTVERAGGDGRRPLDDTELIGDRRFEAESLRAGWATADMAVGMFPPGPSDHDAWRRILEEHPHLAPAIEPGFRVFIDGSAVVLDESRADQLRCCGNGVVPLQAAVAFMELHRRIAEVQHG